MKNILLSALIFLAYGVQAQIITTIAGGGISGLGDNGPATVATLSDPWGIAVDGAGNIYIAERNRHRIRKVSTAGIITTIAGTGTSGYSGDNGQSTAAQLNVPSGVVVDALGNIYFSDDLNSRIRKISTSGIISTVGGNGTYGYSGDNGPATDAQVNGIGGIAIDAMGNIFVSDGGNNRIRRINSFGIITTVAGNGNAGYNGDGNAATSSELYFPNYVAVDNNHNLYIADAYNYRIRKVDASGIISTIAGTGIAGFSGENSPATDAKIWPVTVATDKHGDIYIGDSYNHRIRKVTSGIITTIAGSGASGYGGDNGLAVLAKLYNPVGLDIDDIGNIYIADFGNNRIRFIKSTASITQLRESSFSVKLFPNPNVGNFFINVTSNNVELFNVIVRNGTGDVVKEFSVIANKGYNVKLDIPAGIYTLFMYSVHGVYTEKMIIAR